LYGICRISPVFGEFGADAEAVKTDVGVVFVLCWVAMAVDNIVDGSLVALEYLNQQTKKASVL